MSMEFVNLFVSTINEVCFRQPTFTKFNFALEIIKNRLIVLLLTVKISNVYDSSKSFYFNFANKKEKDKKQNKLSFFQVKMETKE